MIAVRLLNQPAQQKLRCRTDVAVVFLALMRAELDTWSECRPQIVVFLFFVNLVGHELHQSFLIRVQLQRILNAPTDNKGVKRSLNIVRNAHAVCPLDGFAGILRRNHDDGNFVHPLRPGSAAPAPESRPFRAYGYPAESNQPSGFFAADGWLAAHSPLQYTDNALPVSPSASFDSSLNHRRLRSFAVPSGLPPFSPAKFRSTPLFFDAGERSFRAKFPFKNQKKL